MNSGENLSDSANANLSSIERASEKMGLNNNLISESSLKNFWYKEYKVSSSTYADDLRIKNGESFYFVYCWNGEISLTYNKDSVKKIGSFYSAIIMDSEASGITISFKKNTATQICVIAFKDTLETQNSGYIGCKNAFLKNVPEAVHLFMGQPYIELLEKINNLSQEVRKNVSSELIMEGLLYQILGLKMEQLLNVANSTQTDNGSLSNGEMERVQTVSEFIRDNPGLEYNVEFLCRKTGLSPSKLQEGFKRMFNRTVIDYIRHVRLEKSIQLIKTTDLNISEIVYSIGLTSRSYFSKIFKNKYKCSPKSYQEKQSGPFLIS